MYCSDCRFFTDLGRCKNPASRKSDVGYFQSACKDFEPMETQEKTIPEPKAVFEGAAQETRTCNTCGKTLAVSKFARNRWGYTNTCSDCMSAKRAGKKAPTAKPESNPTPKLRKCYITNVADEDLVAELRRRGYTGELVLKREFEL